MQPVQLSLLPQDTPTPAGAVLEHLPEAETVQAIRQLAVLIAKAAADQPETDGDDDA